LPRGYPYARLRPLFESYVERFNTPEFILEDPLSIPHRFHHEGDMEVAAFFAAIFAWGQRKTIINKCTDVLQRMDDAPYDFVMQASELELRQLHGFVHRTFNYADIIDLVKALRALRLERGNWWSWFQPEEHEINYGPVLHRFRQAALAKVDNPQRVQRFLSDPLSGSAAKRLVMFLRWMVRQDATGVDLGIWSQLPMHKLSCPLDVHTSRVARHYNLITRKQNDWLAVEELDLHLRKLSAEDPSRYDFALFGMGVSGQLYS
jgi:uncharacterized protein (TIGR02757 family)